MHCNVTMQMLAAKSCYLPPLLRKNLFPQIVVCYVPGLGERRFIIIVIIIIIIIINCINEHMRIRTTYEQ